MDAIMSPVETRLCRIEAGGVPVPGLFELLESLFPVHFVAGPEGRPKLPGELSLRASRGGNRSEGGARTGSFSAPLPPPSADKSHLADQEVEFADSPDVPWPFRGRRLTVKAPPPVAPIALREGERVLAASHHGPLWTRVEKAGAKHDRTALPLPGIAADQSFFDFFHGERFLELLPLMEFLGQTGGESRYRRPPLRAAYIIDDPNLHWPRYGWVDYREIVRHAMSENYHVAFATIPMDAWFTHAPTAALFRAHPRRLSLLVHGNNHGKHELARRYSEAGRNRLLSQAVGRIRRLERRADLRICRVMVPPHGACSAEMLGSLARHGFESACISAGSLRAFNPGQPWTRTLGFLPSETVNDCPVLPRWAMTGNVENTLLVAAYLGRPMILRGHHRDLREGVEILDKYAGFINSLGSVVWSNLSDLSRLNYLWRLEGGTLWIRPLGKRLDIDLPAGAVEIAVDASGVPGDRAWQVNDGRGTACRALPGEAVRLADGPPRTVFLERVGAFPPPLPTPGFGPVSPRLFCRRLLTEVRDRLIA